MIFQNAIEYREQIEPLLNKAMLTMDAQQIHAWMLFKFDPSNMFCMVEENQVIACIQLKKRTLSFKGKLCQVSYIELAATHPDYQQRKCFGNLLDAALQKACCNDLLTMVYTSSEKLFESRSFIPVSRTKNYWIKANQCKQGNFKNVKKYQPSMNLYPVYLEFMSHFDGSILLDIEQFENQISYLLACHKKIDVMYDEEGNIRGFAVYSMWQNQIHVETILYLDSDAVYDLFNSLQMICEVIQVTVSQDERFEKLFESIHSQKKNAVLVRLNNYKLFSKWIDHDVRNVVQAFAQIDTPIWNHFI